MGLAVATILLSLWVAQFGFTVAILASLYL